TYKGTRAVVVWDPTNSQGQIQLANLPQLDAEKDYQLWIVDPAQKNPVSAGLIHRAADGSAKVPFQPVQVISTAAAFAISIEKAGGVPVGEGPIVILGK
ncbi:MAG: anti-sigma factor, partial [Verrucomicrobiaceae bacterium]